jgi:putative N6-adenine-specific DNA methylase
LAELRRKTAKIDWSLFLRDPFAGETKSQRNFHSIAVRATASKSKLYHTAAIRERLLLGIYESFGYTETDKIDLETILDSSTPSDDNLQSNTSNLLLDVSIERDQVEVFINAFATPLHQRGYRYQVAKAPLREDLAFSMLFTAGWIPSWMSDFEGDNDTSDDEWEGLMDPFCGSGTIAIEGAAMAAGLPPGRLKPAPFQGTTLEDSSKWECLVHNACFKAMNIEKPFKISASDRDAGAVQAALANAKRAGVWKYMEGNVHQTSLSGQPWFEDPSRSPHSFLVVTNPPFGQRVSHKSKLLPLYQTLGHSICQGIEKHKHRVKGVVLTDDPRFVRTIGPAFQFDTILQTNHGGIKVSAMAMKVR